MRLPAFAAALCLGWLACGKQPGPVEPGPVTPVAATPDAGPADAVPLAVVVPDAAPPVPAEPALPGPQEPAAIAALDGTPAKGGKVVVLAQRGDVRLVPGGPLVGGPAGAWAWGAAEERRVGSGTPVRIVTDTGSARVLLHVDEKDFGHALVRPEKLRPVRGGPEPEAGHVELAAGAVVEIAEITEDSAWVWVVMKDPFNWDTDDAFGGWVPGDAIGWEVEPAPFTMPAERPSLAIVQPGADVVDRPKGKKLARFPKSSGTRTVSSWTAVPTGKAVRGFQPIEFVDFCPSDFKLVGWVSTKKVKVVDDLGMGGGCGTGTGGPALWGPLESARRVPVGKGRWLLDTTGTLVVGRTTRDTELAIDDDGVLHVATKFGPVPISLAPEKWKPAKR